MITYPLTLPVNPKPKEVTFIAKVAVSVAESPYTFSQHAQSFDGQAFECEIELPPMTRANAAIWQAFFLKLKGMAGTFLMGDLSYIQQGNATTGDIDGAHSVRDTVLSLKNMTVGQTIKAGDYLQVGTGADSRLHKMLDDHVVDGGGSIADIDIFPSLRDSYADGTSITFVNPVGRFRLASNQMPYTYVARNLFDGMVFAAVEAI